MTQFSSGVHEKSCTIPIRDSAKLLSGLSLEIHGVITHVKESRIWLRILLKTDEVASAADDHHDHGCGVLRLDATVGRLVILGVASVDASASGSVGANMLLLEFSTFKLLSRRGAEGVPPLPQLHCMHRTQDSLEHPKTREASRWQWGKQITRSEHASSSGNSLSLYGLTSTEALLKVTPAVGLASMQTGSAETCTHASLWEVVRSGKAPLWEVDEELCSASGWL